MENGFDRNGFMDYMEDAFDGFDQPFVRNLVANIVEYGLKHERISKDQFCYWLSDMIPEVQFGEVAMFIADESLTNYGLEEKRKAIKSRIV